MLKKIDTVYVKSKHNCWHPLAIQKFPQQTDANHTMCLTPHIPTWGQKYMKLTGRTPATSSVTFVAVELVALFYTNWISRLFVLIDMLTESVMEQYRVMSYHLVKICGLRTPEEDSVMSISLPVRVREVLVAWTSLMLKISESWE